MISDPRPSIGRRLATAAMIPIALLIAPVAARSDDDPAPADGGATVHPPPMVGLARLAGERLRDREAARMFLAILNGSRLGPGEGWFGPGQRRHDWRWLASRFDLDGDGAITPEELQGHEPRFAALDRDGSGAVEAGDLDWSADSPYVRRMKEAEARFRRLDRDSDGVINAREWESLFDRAAGDDEGMTAADLADLLDPPPAPARSGERGGPSRLTLLLGLLNGEIGSMMEGPAVGEPAPDFTLPTQSGTETYTLSESRGEAPVVLIFGSFT